MTGDGDENIWELVTAVDECFWWFPLGWATGQASRARAQVQDSGPGFSSFTNT